MATLGCVALTWFERRYKSKKKLIYKGPSHQSSLPKTSWSPSFLTRAKSFCVAATISAWVLCPTCLLFCPKQASLPNPQARNSGSNLWGCIPDITTLTSTTYSIQGVSQVRVWVKLLLLKGLNMSTSVTQNSWVWVTLSNTQGLNFPLSLTCWQNKVDTRNKLLSYTVMWTVKLVRLLKHFHETFDQIVEAIG